MVKRLVGFLVFVLLSTCISAAQSGTQVSQSIFDNGDIGIGTTAPSAKLDVQNGDLRVFGPNNFYPCVGAMARILLGDSHAGVAALCGIGLRFGVYKADGGGSIGTDSVDAFVIQENTGNVGIGVLAPWARLSIANSGAGSAADNPLLSFSPNNNSINTYTEFSASNDYSQAGSIPLAIRAVSEFATTSNQQVAAYVIQKEGNNNQYSHQWWTNDGSTGPLERVRISNNGNVGIGTTSPGAKLEVNGNVKVSGAGSAITFADGTVQSTAWTGVLCGGDYAESVDVSGSKVSYELGDVIVIDKKHPGRFLKSSAPYSRLVAGIYSTKPGVVGRRSHEAEKAKDEIPMAMVGIVPTKVSAENGPIEIGDLLVTSSTTGRAMKATDFSRTTGAIVGKALGSLDAGTGVVDVLVSLQ